MFDDRVAARDALARDRGLDFFPVSFEVVPHESMTAVAAYGLPTRARHWSYGKVSQHQHLSGTIALQRHLSVLTKSTHVESRFCGRSRQVKAAFCTPVNPCVRSVCSRSVVVGLIA